MDMKIDASQRYIMTSVDTQTPQLQRPAGEVSRLIKDVNKIVVKRLFNTLLAHFGSMMGNTTAVVPSPFSGPRKHRLYEYATRVGNFGFRRNEKGRFTFFMTDVMTKN